jgi:hypothetical protein
MEKFIELIDGVIVLRPFRTEDAKAHLRGEDEAMQKWLNGVKSTIDSVKKMVKHNQETWEKDGPVFISAIRTV